MKNDHRRVTRDGWRMHGSDDLFNMSAPTTTDEAKSYYHGLPSSTVLVARASFTPRNMPSGGQKDLRPVGKHPLGLVWEVDLALKLHSLLGSLDVKWTSTDVVHIGIHGESSALVDLSFGSAWYQIRSLVMLASLRSLGAWIRQIAWGIKCCKGRVMNPDHVIKARAFLYH